VTMKWWSLNNFPNRKNIQWVRNCLLGRLHWKGQRNYQDLVSTLMLMWLDKIWFNPRSRLKVNIVSERLMTDGTLQPEKLQDQLQMLTILWITWMKITIQYITSLSKLKLEWTSLVLLTNITISILRRHQDQEHTALSQTSQVLITKANDITDNYKKQTKWFKNNETENVL